MFVSYKSVTIECTSDKLIFIFKTDLAISLNLKPLIYH